MVGETCFSWHSGYFIRLLYLCLSVQLQQVLEDYSVPRLSQFWYPMQRGDHSTHCACQSLKTRTAFPLRNLFINCPRYKFLALYGFQMLLSLYQSRKKGKQSQVLYSYIDPPCWIQVNFQFNSQVSQNGIEWKNMRTHRLLLKNYGVTSQTSQHSWTNHLHFN